jgi:hypothetical protein
MGVYYWPEWSGFKDGEHLDADGNFGPDAPCFFLFSDQDITGAANHQPCIVAASEYEETQVWPADFTWQLRGALVYRLDENNFDVIGLMHSTTKDFNLPEFQLRFARGEAGWTWRRADTGFINPFIYAPALDGATEDTMARLDAAIEHYGNMLSLYLGGYHKWLQCDGTWEERLPKQARVKKDKRGRVKKFYSIASSGFLRFKPEHKDATEETSDTSAAG